MATSATPAAPVVAARGRGPGSERSKAVLLGGGFIVVVLACWQVTASLGWVNTFLNSSPALIAKELWNQTRSGTLPRSLGVSALEFAIGFALAGVAGVLVGLAIGRYRYVEYALDPYVWLLYSSPVIALFPLLVLMLGLGHPTVIAITFLTAVVPVLVNASQGVRDVDRGLLRAAKSFGAGETALLYKVILPASVPAVMAGLRLGMGRALVGMVVGEFFAGNGGIGYNVSYYASQLQTTSVLAAVVVVVAAGVLLNVLARLLERLADSWRTDVR
jgi:NitT/TauT family transport system permease protein